MCEGSDHVFFDSAHFSEKVYQQFAELLWSGTPNISLDLTMSNHCLNIDVFRFNNKNYKMLN